MRGLGAMIAAHVEISVGYDTRGYPLTDYPRMDDGWIVDYPAHSLDRLSLGLRVLQRRQWMSLKSFADLAFWEAQLPQYSIIFALKPLERPYRHTEAVGTGERAYCWKVVTVTVTLSLQFSCKDFNSCILFVERRGILLDGSILQVRPFVRYRA